MKKLAATLIVAATITGSKVDFASFPPRFEARRSYAETSQSELKGLVKKSIKTLEEKCDLKRFGCAHYKWHAIGELNYAANEGADTSAALPALERLLTVKNESLGMYSARAIARYHMNKKAPIEQRKSDILLRHDDKDVRLGAAAAIIAHPNATIANASVALDVLNKVLAEKPANKDDHYTNNRIEFSIGVLEDAAFHARDISAAIPTLEKLVIDGEWKHEAAKPLAYHFIFKGDVNKLEKLRNMRVDEYKGGAIGPPAVAGSLHFVATVLDMDMTAFVPLLRRMLSNPLPGEVSDASRMLIGHFVKKKEWKEVEALSQHKYQEVRYFAGQALESRDKTNQ